MPCLLGLFSLVILLDRQFVPQTRWPTTASARYRKQRRTFTDTFAAVRRKLWRKQGLAISTRVTDMRKLRPALRRAITYAFCHAE